MDTAPSRISVTTQRKPRLKVAFTYKKSTKAVVTLA